MSGKQFGHKVINFTGTWELSSSENYPEWMDAMGISESQRTRYLACKPRIEILHEGDVFSYVSRKGDVVKDMRKKIGAQYLDKTHDMNEVRVPSWEANRLVIKAASNPPGKWTTTCELVGGKLFLSYTSHTRDSIATDVTAKRWFSRVQEPDTIA